MQKNILVIDDEQIVLKSIKKFLEGHGYGVEIAQSGAEALEKIQKEKFDLIISDVRMPGMSGVETLKEIREKYQEQNNIKIPTIIITGYSSDEAQDQAADLGVVDFLYKPFELEEFYKTVKRNLETKPVYRRAHPRVTVSFLADINIKDSSYVGLKADGEILNLSEGGFCLATKTQLPINSHTRIKIDFSPIKAPIEVDALVVWVDPKEEKNIFYCGFKFLEIEEAQDGILKEILIKYLFLDERFVSLAKDTEIHLRNLKNKLDEFDKKNSEEQKRVDFIRKDKDTVFSMLDKYFNNAWVLIKNFDRHKHAIHQAYYRQKLLRLFLCAETNRHVVEKPLGYPGDYNMMNYILNYYGDNKYLGEPSFEKLLNNYTCNIPICSSNVKRKDFFKEKILETMNKKDNAKIASFGSGPARELIELLKEGKIAKPLTFKCLDLEQKALDYVKSEMGKIDSKKKSMLTIAYIHRDIVALIRDSNLREEFKECDLIYASGLFDYLKLNTASRLTKELYGLLAKDGELIICNADTNYASHRAYYEFLGGWVLVYKTKEEMLGWVKNIDGIDNTNIKFEEFKDGNHYLFLNIKKG